MTHKGLIKRGFNDSAGLCCEISLNPSIPCAIGAIEYYRVTIDSDGRETWLSGSQVHRMDGPAVTTPSGTQLWYQNGQLHRDGGPAIVHPNGDWSWHHRGEVHREDGPAVKTNRSTGYVLHGVRLTEGQFNRVLNDSLLTPARYYVRCNPDGVTMWFSDPEMYRLHRIDGPAIHGGGRIHAYHLNGTFTADSLFERITGLATDANWIGTTPTDWVSTS